MLALGASARSRASKGGTKIISPMSDVVIVKTRSVSLGRNAGVRRMSREIIVSTAFTGSAIDSAKGVGRMPRPVERNN